MNDTFLKAARGEATDHIPVWFMRQAGRSLPGYRALRQKYGVLELTQTPELAAQVSMEPIEKLGVDAAILFADIMLLPIAMGIEVEIIDSVGPVIDKPIVGGDFARLAPLERENVAYLGETIRLLRAQLQVPLIGFSGAPFTLASYLIEGRPTRTWSNTKRFMLERPQEWHELMRILSDGIIEYLSFQVDAGAQALQIFDSWVGCLAPSDYRTHVLPHMQRIFTALEPKRVPRIHFATNTAGFLEDFANIDAEVIGVDWRIDLADAKKCIGAKSLQGNLDPHVLLAEQSVIEHTVDTMIDSLPSTRGYIFNLGHGILPESDDKKVRALVDYVHAKPVG
jgi:uroporphyrinogen decarboxylase